MDNRVWRSRKMDVQSWESAVMVSGSVALFFAGGGLLEAEGRSVLARVLREGPEVKPGRQYTLRVVLTEGPQEGME